MPVEKYSRAGEWLTDTNDLGCCGGSGRVLLFSECADKDHLDVGRMPRGPNDIEGTVAQTP